MKIIIPTCNRYIRFIEANIIALNQNWPDHPDIYILGYEEPKFKLSENIKFFQIGTDDSIHKWSIDIKNFLIENYDDDYLILHLDDFIVTNKVDHEHYTNFYNKIIKYKFDKGFLGISYGFNEDEYKNFKKFDDFFIFPENSKYRLSLNTAIWKRDYIISKLQNEMNPWQFEVQQGGGANDGSKILLSKTPILIYGDLMHRGQYQKSNWYDDVIAQGYSVDEQFVNKIESII